MLNKKAAIPIWSNIPFLIPAALAFYKAVPLYGSLITVATIVSYYHHSVGGKAIKITDHILAFSVISANLYILKLANFEQPYFGIALLFVAIAFFFFFTGKNEKYDVRHGLWHLCSVIITLCCVLAY